MKSHYLTLPMTPFVESLEKKIIALAPVRTRHLGCLGGPLPIGFADRWAPVGFR